MDRSLRQTSAAAFLAAGCVFSASSHAYSAAEDAEAQEREVKAAYDRGYQAAKDEMARAATAKASAVSSTPPAATRTQKAATPPPRKPILDIKSTFSDAGHIEKVQEVPVTATPLPEENGPETPPSTQAHVVPQPSARSRVAAAADASAKQESPQNQQPVQSANAQVRDSGNRIAARRSVQQEFEPPEDAAYDDGDDDAEAPRTAQVYTTTPRYAREPEQYAPPPVAMRQAPQPYGYVQQPAYASPQQYGYVQQSTYAAPHPNAYYAPPAPWGAQYQSAPPAGRWYWSPQYGRWLYY